MNWINSVVRPKIRSFLNRRETAENLWVKCPESGEMVFHLELEANSWVVPNSGHHMRIKAGDRLDLFFDDKQYDRVELPTVVADPLKFRDSKKYTDRLKEARSKTGMEDAVLVATGKLMGNDIVAAVQDFEFMAGTLGMAAGSAVVKGIETALELRVPFVLFAASGGARMQEGILALMQMPRTTVAVSRLREAGLPYICVFTNPTTGGVTASYAMLGDVHIAEPGALICFAGPRVIEQTIREKLPPGFQKSEYLLEHGMVDMVVHRHELRGVIGNLVAILTKSSAPAVLTASEAAADEPAVVTPDQGGDELIENPPIGAHAE
ncbi:MAG: acetyl-CoA carboxylase carboxyltransferase subunit beta [Alphaproteobacteria bacterium]|nr:acetyl-CoA carboxylase carboxyltransferase subunit beta [Alphaproteobacteria bacterium]